MAPPSTTIPSGGPRVSSQGGKRGSSGMISALPNGESPITASAIRLATIKSLPMRARRVAKSRTPRSPSMIARLEGIAKKPKTLDRMKNIGSPQLDGSALLLPRLVARPGLVVHGIEAGKPRAFLDLAHDPALHALLLGPFPPAEFPELLRTAHCP